MPSTTDRTGSFASGPFHGLLPLVREWTGGDATILLAGSHASDEAVWAAIDGRRVSLSDVDLYVVLSDRAACAAARRRRAASPRTPALAAIERHLAAPLEAAFLTRGDLARLPARPGTIELSRHARVLEGDPAALAAIPRFAGRDVTAEEITLLLENRAFDLLDAVRHLGAPGVPGLRSRHLTLRVARDLASAITLAAGEYPDGSGARMAWALAHEPRQAAPLAALWDRWSAWQAAPQAAASRSEALDEWRLVARSWLTFWLARAGSPAAAPEERWKSVRALARRAPLRRRLRQALAYRSRRGEGPAWWNRVTRFAIGTPQHRLNASAGVLLIDACERDGSASGDRALSAPAADALRSLGVLRPDTGWDALAARAVWMWDRWILGGQRGADPA